MSSSAVAAITAQRLQQQQHQQRKQQLSLMSSSANKKAMIMMTEEEVLAKSAYYFSECVKAAEIASNIAKTATPMPKAAEKYAVIRNVIVRDLMCGIPLIDNALNKCLREIDAGMEVQCRDYKRAHEEQSKAYKAARTMEVNMRDAYGVCMRGNFETLAKAGINPNNTNAVFGIATREPFGFGTHGSANVMFTTATATTGAGSSAAGGASASAGGGSGGNNKQQMQQMQQLQLPTLIRQKAMFESLPFLLLPTTTAVGSSDQQQAAAAASALFSLATSSSPPTTTSAASAAALVAAGLPTNNNN
jgi:hypothetical protein